MVYRDLSVSLANTYPENCLDLKNDKIQKKNDVKETYSEKVIKYKIGQ